MRKYACFMPFYSHLKNRSIIIYYTYQAAKHTARVIFLVRVVQYYNIYITPNPRVSIIDTIIVLCVSALCTCTRRAYAAALKICKYAFQFCVRAIIINSLHCARHNAYRHFSEKCIQRETTFLTKIFSDIRRTLARVGDKI